MNTKSEIKTPIERWYWRWHQAAPPEVLSSRAATEDPEIGPFPDPPQNPDCACCERPLSGRAWVRYPFHPYQQTPRWCMECVDAAEFVEREIDDQESWTFFPGEAITHSRVDIWAQSELGQWKVASVYLGPPIYTGDDMDYDNQAREGELLRRTHLIAAAPALLEAAEAMAASHPLAELTNDELAQCLGRDGKPEWKSAAILAKLRATTAAANGEVS